MIRIDEHVQPRSINRPFVNTSHQRSIEDCTILKPLKGTAPENKDARLRLFANGVRSGPEGFDVYSCHVVLLKMHPDDGSGINYEGIKYENNQIQVSPDWDTAAIAGKPLKESIRILADQYVRYRDETRREDIRSRCC